MLVLSIFPGGGLLDFAFEAEGYCVVRGPDPLWGGDVRTFHPPSGCFTGIIGGDPCQSHSKLANLVRARGLEPSFPDLTQEYARVVSEARPMWFLRENVPQAPDPAPPGYTIRSFLLDNSTLDSGDGTGNEQKRRRRWWFGVREDVGFCPDLRRWIDFALFVLPEATQAVSGDSRPVPVARGGSGRVKVTAVAGKAGHAEGANLYRSAPVTGRHEGAVGSPEKNYAPPPRSLAEMLRLQGLPESWLEHQPWTMQAKRKIVGNGVAVPMGRALARAILAWTQSTS